MYTKVEISDGDYLDKDDIRLLYNLLRSSGSDFLKVEIKERECAHGGVIPVIKIEAD
jgi:hypothetical protein